MARIAIIEKSVGVFFSIRFIIESLPIVYPIIKIIIDINRPVTYSIRS